MGINFGGCDQVLNKLREAEIQLQQGATIAVVSKTIGVSSHTFYRWRREYGGLRIEQARKLKSGIMATPNLSLMDFTVALVMGRSK